MTDKRKPESDLLEGARKKAESKVPEEVTGLPAGNQPTFIRGENDEECCTWCNEISGGGDGLGSTSCRDCGATGCRNCIRARRCDTCRNNGIDHAEANQLLTFLVLQAGFHDVRTFAASLPGFAFQERPKVEVDEDDDGDNEEEEGDDE